MRIPRNVAGALTFALIAATLGGRVLDTTTGQPLAHVRLRVGAASATTDARGRFVLRGLHPGVVTITLESDDVPLQRARLRIAPGGRAARSARL